MILTEELKINGEIVDIAGYSFNTPTGGLGQSLQIALVDPFLDILPDNAEITFRIGAGKRNGGGVDYSYITVLENGRLNGLNYTAAWLDDEGGGSPNDTLEFTALSPLADRLNLTPEFPVIMYNPSLINSSSLVPDDSQLIRELVGGVYTYLRPVLEARAGLSFYHVLDRAYTHKNPLLNISPGCNYDKVITNIPDFLIGERMDFTLESGWHNPAASLYSKFNPVLFEDSNILYIISPEFGLPPGFEPTPLDARCVIELSRSQDAVSLINAIILSYYNGNATGTAGEIPKTELIEDDPQETGSGQNYTRTEVTRSITSFLDINTGEIRRVQENYITTKVYSYRPARNISTDTDGNIIVIVDIEGGSVVLTSEEQIENTYAGLVKSGHTRTTKALYLDPDTPGAPYKFGTVLTENASLVWRPDMSHPGQYEYVSSSTLFSGLCLVESIDVESTPITNNPDETPSNNPFSVKVKYTQKIYTPILDAVDAGLVAGDGKQTIQELDLYTILEYVRDTGQNQNNIETRVVNHLTGGVKPPNIQSRPGSRSTYIPPFSIRWGGGIKAGTIRELIKDQDSIDLYGLRSPGSLDIGRLNPEIGRQIVRQRLKLAASPPRLFDITLPGINFFYRRGIVITPPLRSGYDRTCIITGTNITGRALHTPQAVREMRLNARELVNVNS